MKKIIFLKGEATSGKSTAFRNLRKKKEMEGWVFLENPELKSWFEGIEEKRELQKRALFALIKECMKYKKNIILEEMSAKTARKYLKSNIKKYGYSLLTFEFVLGDVKKTLKRDLKRVTNNVKHHKKVLTKKFILEVQKHHRENIDKNTVFIDTSKLGKKKVVDLILKKIK